MLNNVTLIGYLGNDAEARATRNESTMTTLSIATNRTWKDRETGEKRKQVTWNRCVLFGRPAEYASRLPKGAQVQVVGELQNRQYIGSDGAKKSITEIRVHQIARLDRAAKQGNGDEGAAA